MIYNIICVFNWAGSQKLFVWESYESSNSQLSVFNIWKKYRKYFSYKWSHNLKKIPQKTFECTTNDINLHLHLWTYSINNSQLA